MLFKGFDLNDPIESKYYSFYEFLVEQLGKYSEIKELMKEGKIEDFNSHGFGPNMSTLEEMIRKYAEIRESKRPMNFEDLTFEEMQTILNV